MPVAADTDERVVADVAAGLRAVLLRAVPEADDLTIANLSRSGGGSSRENWSFDARWTTGGQPVERHFLLRRDPATGVVDTDREAEYRVLSRLESLPILTPVVWWFDPDGSELGRPFMILERAPGAADRAVLTDRDPLRLGDDHRVALARRACELLADVHRVDVASAGLDRVLPPAAVRPGEHEVSRWDADIARQALEPQPGLRLASWWLHDHVPPAPARPVLVHGDYRPANLLVDHGGGEMLLDWELAHLGDPMEDVGWYCTPIYRREHFIPGRWEQADFLRCYRERSGIAVDPDALRFWQALAAYKLAALALAAVRIFCDGDSSRPPSPVGPVVRQVLQTIGPLADGAAW